MLLPESVLIEFSRSAITLTDPATGFLPNRLPVRNLPAPFEEISLIVSEFPHHYHNAPAGIRLWLEQRLAACPPDWALRLQDLDESQLLSLMLKVSLLCHAFRWERMPTTPGHYEITSIRLPAKLDTLWTALADKLRVPRVGIFQTMICSNFTLEGGVPGETYEIGDLQPDKLDVLHTWLLRPEAEEVRTFVITALMMEAQGKSAIDAASILLEGLTCGDPRKTVEGLERLRQVITATGQVFNSQIKVAKMKPVHFLTLIQPTMIWLIDGLEGASGPQCCTVQFLDSILGIARDGHLGKLILESRNYLLPRHRLFLECADRIGLHVRAILSSPSYSKAQPQILALYDACLESLTAWRVSHQKRGAHYLKEDPAGPASSYTSTGLMIHAEQDRVEVFESNMQTRIDSTRESLLTQVHAVRECAGHAAEAGSGQDTIRRIR